MTPSSGEKNLIFRIRGRDGFSRGRFLLDAAWADVVCRAADLTTDRRWPVDGGIAARCSQVRPPSIVYKTTPYERRVNGMVPPPAIQPTRLLKKHTDRSGQSTPLDCNVQVSPASSECQMTPWSPTAQPWRVSTN